MAPMHESADLDFYPFGPPAEPAAPELPNASRMSRATLGGPRGDGAFIASRPLNPSELADAWAKHHARHGRKP